MRKRILGLLLVLCIVIGIVPTSAAAVTADSFTDVSKGSWYYDYVDYVARKGYFVGTTNTTFSPNRDMTRAMFVVVLARFDDVAVDNHKSSFSDVTNGAWCAGAIEWAAENNIVTGYSDGSFKPNESITRAQMCSIMDRYVDYYTKKHNVTVEQKGTVATLSDQNQIPAYAAKAVENCQKYGLIYGYEDGTFRPAADSTRAHVAAIIYRLSVLIADAAPVKASEGGGGGGGGGGGTPPTPPTKDTYLVTVSIDPEDSLYPTKLDLIADYTVTTESGKKTGDTTVDALAQELVTGENETALKSAIEKLFADQLKGKSTTVTVSGEKVTVNVSDAYEISATTTVPVSSIANSNSRARNVTKADIESLTAKLEKGGELTLTAADVDTLDELISKLEGMTPEDILDYIETEGSEAMKQAAVGLTEEAIEEARGTYIEQLKDVQKEAKAAAVDENGNVSVTISEAVTMTVNVDLQSYLKQIESLYNDQEKKEDAIKALASKLGVTDDKLEEADVAAAIEKIYALSDPNNFVDKTGDNSLKLKNADGYYKQLQEYVTAMCGLREALGESSDFYAAQLSKAKTYADAKDFLDVKYDGTLATLLGTTGNITNTITGDILDVDVIVNDGTYPDLAGLLRSNLSNRGHSGIAEKIPQSVPVQLSQFLGTYSLKVSIEKQ